MTKKILILSFLFMPFFMNAQIEIGLMAGGSNYSGDLAPETVRASVGQTHAAFGGFLRYGFGKYVTARLNVAYGTISADDAKASNQGQIDRNLSFRSRVLEAGLIGEFNILGYRAYNYESVFSPYVFVGITGFKYNPQAFFDNQWIDLQPLGTEGQGLDQRPAKYNLVEYAIPFGLGVKYAINDKFNVGLEVGMRKTFTDYLDDVSTTYVAFDELAAGNGELAAQLGNRSGRDIATGTNRGNAENDDWFLIAGFTVSYNISDNGLVGARRKNSRKSGCPTF